MTTSELLLQTAARGELHHALILHGPSSDLLLRTAMSVARAVNCESQSGTDDCAACTRIDRGVHPDVHVVAVSDERKMIAVEQIRDVIGGATLRPYEGKYKVYVIDPADAMSVSGANALLKTLEEPTRDTLFLLLTRSADLLLPTIRSRSQAIAIRDELTASAAVIAQRDRISLQLARLVVSFPARERKTLDALCRELIDALAEFASTRNSAALLRAAVVFSDQEPASEGLAIFASILRDAAALAPEQSYDPAQAAIIQEKLDRAQLLTAADRALRGVSRLVVNVDVRLVYEQALSALVRK